MTGVALLAPAIEQPTSCAGGAPATCAAEPVAAPAAPVGPAWGDLALLVVILAVALFGLRYVVANERRRRAAALPAPAVDAVPYRTGAALGLVVAASLVAFGHPLGVSGAFQHLAGLLGRRLWPATRYWGEVIPVGLTWQVWVVLGLFVGAYLSAALGGTFELEAVPSAWARRFGPSVARRWLVAFAAGVVLELAGAIAGGCTSGLALSGGVVLSVGAFLFMAAMFAAGIPAAFLSRRLGRRP